MGPAVQDAWAHDASEGESEAWSLRCSEIREALRTIAALYLRADVPGIRQVIDKYRLADILTQYLLAQYKQSATLSGLGLQLSKAFVVDALAGAPQSPNNAQGPRHDTEDGTADCPHASSSRGAAPQRGAHGAGWAADKPSSTASLRRHSTMSSDGGIAARSGSKALARMADKMLAGHERPKGGSSSGAEAPEQSSGARSGSSLRRFGTRTILQYLMQVRLFCRLQILHALN